MNPMKQAFLVWNEDSDDQRMTNRRFENAARHKNYPETLIRDKIKRAGRVSREVEKRTHI